MPLGELHMHMRGHAQACSQVQTPCAARGSADRIARFMELRV